jgi:hypothetical protein
LIKFSRLILLPVLCIFIFVSPNQTQAAHDDPNPCIGIASDSNGYGQVTFQLPTTGEIGIVFVRPLAVVLEDVLREAGLYTFKVSDRSLSASGVTATGRTAYLKSIPYGNLINDRCQYVIAGPFIPDIAANSATPRDYVLDMAQFVSGLVDKNPRGTIFILRHYQTARADFTKDNSGFGLTKEHIDQFNQAMIAGCASDGPLGRYPQVVCVDTQPFFEGMGQDYLLVGANAAQYHALVYRQTGFTPKVEDFFAHNADGVMIGDGIHLSLAGRYQMMRGVVALIAARTDF